MPESPRRDVDERTREPQTNQASEKNKGARVVPFVKLKRGTRSVSRSSTLAIRCRAAG